MLEERRVQQKHEHLSKTHSQKHDKKDLSDVFVTGQSFGQQVVDWTQHSQRSGIWFTLKLFQCTSQITIYALFFYLEVFLGIHFCNEFATAERQVAVTNHVKTRRKQQLIIVIRRNYTDSSKIFIQLLQKTNNINERLHYSLILM